MRSMHLIRLYAKNIGVDIDKLVYFTAGLMESRHLRSQRRWFAPEQWISLIVDSVAALVPKAEIDGDMGDSHVGLQARLMSQASP